ncbi:MAG: hypothetical protein JO127_05085 [Caulobacteraceae bacterium]|nr:hypothetical protein [Caulobacteraceae bacterium]
MPNRTEPGADPRSSTEEWVCRQNIERLRSKLSHNQCPQPELLSELLADEERRLRRLIAHLGADAEAGRGGDE